MDISIIFLSVANYKEHCFLKVLVNNDFIENIYVPSNKKHLLANLKMGDDVTKYISLSYNFKEKSIKLVFKDVK